MNLYSIFRDFNPSKFVVFSSLFAFVVLFALRLDGYIDWSFWAIFTPLWIWKGITVLGAIVGAIFWFCNPHYRYEDDFYTEFKAMQISVYLHLILLIFELLACDKLASDSRLWFIAFTPLILGSIASVGASVWLSKHNHDFELEFFLAVNAFQFVFLPLKLDDFIQWKWNVVFIPMWIKLAFTLVCMIFKIILCTLLIRSPDFSLQQKNAAVRTTIGQVCVILPLLCFQIVICVKLEGDLQCSSIVACIPLLVSIFALIVLSFRDKGGNLWWFGIRKSFGEFLLSTMPCLQIYGNVSYRAGQNDPDAAQSAPLDDVYYITASDYGNYQKESMQPVVPIISIEMPD